MGATSSAHSQDGPLLRPGAAMQASPRGSSSSVDDGKAARTGYEFLELLRDLEAQLADPRDVPATGKAYETLAKWTTAHSNDREIVKVMEWLSADSRYPAWRRQALEEAYRMFFDDAARRGIKGQLDKLPEPPNSEDIGFRRLPENLLSGAAAMGSKFSGLYEEGGGDDGTCVSRTKTRWEYEIRKCSVPMTPDEAVGREIILRDTQHESRSYGCAQVRLGWLAQMMPDCCNRGNNGKPPAHNASERPDFSSALPPGKPRSRKNSSGYADPMSSAMSTGGSGSYDANGRRQLAPGGFREAAPPPVAVKVL